MLLAYDRRLNESMGVLPQWPITLCGKIVLIDMVVVNHHLDFNMLLGHDYVYDMNVVVCSLFRVMYFPHNGSIFIIDKLASDNHHPNLRLAQNSWYVSSVQVDSALPHVNYVALHPKCLISSEKDPLYYYFPSRNFVIKVDIMISPMGKWDPLLPSFDSYTSHHFLDVELPL